MFQFELALPSAKVHVCRMMVTVVDFYVNASNGPTIRIDSQDTAAIEALLALFERLSSEVDHVADASSIKSFKVLNSVRSLVLKSCSSISSKKVIQVATGVFECHGTPDDWENARHLTIPLLHGVPAHQYLNNGLQDDVTIEVAVMEPRQIGCSR
jgi:hypothetical protein